MHRKLLFVAILVFSQVFSFAQAKKEFDVGGYELKVDVESVLLNLSVRERESNRSIAGLARKDFLVYEDGIQQDIVDFLPTEAPFNLLLLLDVSGSTGSYIKLMKHAAIEFANSLNPEDRIAIATFNSKVKLIQNFTDDRELAEKAIKRVKSGGGTAFYDALMTSLSQYVSGVEGRTAIVVFTDGVDNQIEGMPESGSETRFEDLYRKVQETDAIIYTIFLDTESQTRLSSYPGSTGGSPGWPGGRRSGGLSFPFPFPFPSGPQPIPTPRPTRGNGDTVYNQARDQLKMIADQTAGRMYSPRKIAELSDAYSEIAGDLRVQYQVAYNSSNRSHDGKWRNIRVQLENNPDAVVRTRRGYYARREMTQ